MPSKKQDIYQPMTHKEVDQLLRATLHGPLPQGTVNRMMATLALWNDVTKAATQWWYGHRPLAFSTRQHLNNPTINTCGGRGESDLARAVAEYRKSVTGKFA